MRSFLFLLASIFVLTSCQEKGPTQALIETDFGNITIELFDSTPKHRDNFIKLANEGFYNGTLFHRVMQNFMIQGGDPDSKGAAPGVQLGQGGPGYTLDAEIGALHYKGAVAAARLSDDQNPQRASSGSQFYIVQGLALNEQMLNSVQQQTGAKYTPEEFQKYIELGGYPPLDGQYTVFGQVIEGMDVVEKIAQVNTDPANRPTQDIHMKVSIIK